ncbi:MAG: hypothetical protein ACI8SE_000282 [Bacteroidia bacterium]|jgi:hypothetical protein
MKRFKQIGIILCVILLSCNSEIPVIYTECDVGYPGDPLVYFTSERDSFLVVYSDSDNRSDTVQIDQVDFDYTIPIDFSDSLMTYEIIQNDSSFGTVILKYKMTPVYCGEKDKMYLIFTHMYLDKNGGLSEANIRYTGNANSMTNLVAIPSLYKYINEGGVLIYIKF